MKERDVLKWSQHVLLAHPPTAQTIAGGWDRVLKQGRGVRLLQIQPGEEIPRRMQPQPSQKVAREDMQPHLPGALLVATWSCLGSVFTRLSLWQKQQMLSEH